MRPLLLTFILVCLTACGGPEPRRPVKVKTGSFMKESVERNRQLLAEEEELILSLIKADTLHNYMETDFGAWFYYNEKIEGDMIPQADDLVTLTYDLVSLQNDTIYSREEIGVIQYRVDREELLPGLRSAIKLMKANESATFLFPSALGYGYHGDNDRIGTNTPLKSTIQILNIERKKDSIQN